MRAVVPLLALVLAACCPAATPVATGPASALAAERGVVARGDAGGLVLETPNGRVALRDPDGLAAGLLGAEAYLRGDRLLDGSLWVVWAGRVVAAR